MNDLETLELKISKFLRWGVVFSGILMLSGWIISFKWTADSFVNFQTYDHISIQELIGFHWKKKDIGPLVSYAGLFALISLPLIRVFLTGILFIRSGEKILATIAALVLLGLFISFSFGIEL